MGLQNCECPCIPVAFIVWAKKSIIKILHANLSSQTASVVQLCLMCAHAMHFKHQRK